MKNIDEATQLTIAIARLLAAEMTALGNPWTKAFLRVEFEDGSQTCKGSYIGPTGAHLFNVLSHKQMFRAIHELAPRLREAQSNDGRKFLVGLLILESNYDYEFRYEYLDSSRWAISKLGGDTGVPAGIDA